MMTITSSITNVIIAITAITAIKYICTYRITKVVYAPHHWATNPHAIPQGSSPYTSHCPAESPPPPSSPAGSHSARVSRLLSWRPTPAGHCSPIAQYRYSFWGGFIQYICRLYEKIRLFPPRCIIVSGLCVRRHSESSVAPN